MMMAKISQAMADAKPNLNCSKRNAIEQKNQHERGAARPALGHHVGVGEHLVRGDDAEDHDEEDGGRQHGDGHVDEAPPHVGPVNVRGVVQLRGDALQPGQER